jgi:S1-C subfamily serine protease
MVNTDGEVIGVTVAYVMTGNKKPTGIGYAIPINQALKLARQLLVDTD